MKQPKLDKLKIDVEGTKAIRKAMAKTKKIKITVNIDGDLIAELRSLASETATPYQTLMNKMLRDAVFKKKDEGSRLDRLEREVAKLKKKLSA